jgi:hypothetical protein
MKKAYTITITDLLNRPIIRTDFEEEWMNKMTNEELAQWDRESYQFCIDEGVSVEYPNINAAHLAKYIDQTILYTLFKEHEENPLPQKNP